MLHSVPTRLQTNAWQHWVNQDMLSFNFKPPSYSSAIPTSMACAVQLAKALRKGPFQTQILMGGVDKRAAAEGEGKDDASLFWLDYLGTLQKVTD